jgi:hypothetical protein
LEQSFHLGIHEHIQPHYGMLCISTHMAHQAPVATVTCAPRAACSLLA